ncbi:uncharacterized protein F4807DRAFT_373704 [Annulohypoxylon truncatum]|uniref:uncharacterized protein n=1 Tax=Annulohypoxylon truncatum TaxID=327061 RepID=UPI002008D0BF|nr:uncharacterized protein F4807DRAFT_373704 [Annulohypoxylon truncatum]KAI1212497.1 hypothetical protein F4807DRAFT_373704 [Annulohypoxylon truncatum]
MALILGTGVGVFVTGILTRIVTGETTVSVVVCVIGVFVFSRVLVTVTVEGGRVELLVLLMGLLVGLIVTFAKMVAVTVVTLPGRGVTFG